jgi:hypothetical protein
MLGTNQLTELNGGVKFVGRVFGQGKMAGSSAMDPPPKATKASPRSTTSKLRDGAAIEVIADGD